MTILYFDIETIPAAEKDIPFLRSIHEAKLAKDLEHASTRPTPEDFDDFYRQTSLNAAYGRVLCIGICKETDGVEMGKTVLSGNEKEMLTKFWGVCRDVQLYVGHGIRFFDLKYLTQRSIINSVPYKEVPLKKFADFPIYDTMDQWMRYEGTISLHELSHCLDIPSPKDGGIDGSQVYDFYLANKQQEIYDYCLRDVETVKAVYKRLIKSEKNTKISL